MGLQVKICIISGSRADLGLLHYPQKLLEEDSHFEGQLMQLWGLSFADAYVSASTAFAAERPDMILVLGDRFEILAAVTAAHLQRIPIAHIGGGDVTEGSYDDAMRDAISRMSTLHFVTSFAAMARLTSLGYRNVHLVGNPAVDYIRHADWKRERPIEEPYVVVSYQAETIDDTVDLEAVNAAINGRRAVWIAPNPDRGSERIPATESYSHDAFLTLLSYCEEFIGNSSAIFYEAPELGVKCKLIGKRQRGRVVPWGGDGRASERIRDVLRLWPSS